MFSEKEKHPHLTSSPSTPHAAKQSSPPSLSTFFHKEQSFLRKALQLYQ